MGSSAKPLEQFLVAEIRRARTAAGMTQESFGRAAGFSASHVSAVESGHRRLTADFVRGADKALNTGGLFGRIATSLGTPTWFRPWLDAEREATQLRLFEPQLIPGLLQTEEYARMIFRLDSRISDEEIDDRVATRMGRRTLLDRDPMPRVTAVVDESALRRVSPGTEKMMAEQLRHLVACGERANVSIHVIPAKVGFHPGLCGPIALACMSDGTWVGYVEHYLGGVTTTDPSELDTLFESWEGVRDEALPRQQSLELIKELAEQWT